jgi:hypothetical protein
LKVFTTNRQMFKGMCGGESPLKRYGRSQVEWESEGKMWKMFPCMWNSHHDLRKKEPINKAHRKERANQENPKLLMAAPILNEHSSSTPWILCCAQLPLIRHPNTPLLLLLSFLDKFFYQPLAPKSQTVCWLIFTLEPLVILPLILGTIVGLWPG